MSKPTTDEVFGPPGSPLNDAWMDYICELDPQERLRSLIRLMAIQKLAKPPSFTTIIVSC